ncbi:uncharacterized protein LOC126613964 [Malus sylvestris]|uniref:uncharacterized protein LOC126613964 n=1 Tax=Malus sylvestris TaxID=3752 RepID=UPI0021AD2891|nr:uncharacterized protein LOC126613964 [Malus sylvestris]
MGAEEEVEDGCARRMEEDHGSMFLVLLLSLRLRRVPRNFILPSPSSSPILLCRKAECLLGFIGEGREWGGERVGVRKTQRKEGSSGEKSTVPFGDLVYERVSVVSLEDVEQRYIHRKGKLKPSMILPYRFLETSCNPRQCKAE